MRRSVWFVAALIALAFAAPALAQVQTGSILVRATDEQGAVIPGVTVTITSGVLPSAMSGVTDTGGAFRFPSLPPSTYTVKLELQGFQTLQRENVLVQVGQTTPLDLTLKVATVSETVTVTGASPAVDTTSANVNVTLSQQLLQATPGGRDIWSLVEYKVPGLVSSRPDVGGAAGGLQGAMVARGTPNSQNVQFLNGVNVGDPAAIGFTGFYYDYDAFEEIQVSTGAHDLSVPSAGVFLNMVTRSGGNRYSGKAAFLFQNHNLQGSNVSDDLFNLGFRREPPAAGSVDYVSDGTFNIGGPIAKKLRFFTAFRDWRVHVSVPGFPEIEQTNMTSGLGTVTVQATDNNRFTGFYARQYYKKPNRGASAFNNPTSNFNEDDVFNMGQGLWNSVLSSKAFLDARFTFNTIFFPLFQKGSDQSLFDLATSFLDRAAQQEQVFNRKRLQANANLQYYVDQALGGRHEVRVGFDTAHMPTTTAVHRIDDLDLFYNSATRQNYLVTLFNSPVNSKANVDQTAVYAQDTYTVKRLTLIGGARWERVEGYLPAQSSPPSRWFPDLPRSFDAVRDIPLWHTIGPRLSAAYDVTGDGKTALKAAIGRYYYTISTGTPNNVNPNFSVSEQFVWNDVNNDLHFQPTEVGRSLGRSGGLITSFDPNLKRPYTDEITAGVDRELMANLKLSAVFTYHTERDQLGNHDVGIPFSAYSPVPRVDLGRDGVAGTADDSAITVFTVDPSFIGRNKLLIVNDSAWNQDYKGFEITATKRYSNLWQVVGGYTYSRTIQNAFPPALSTVFSWTPNQLINAEGRPDQASTSYLDRPHLFKLTGSYMLPRDVRVAGNFRAQSGQSYTRQTRLSLNQGSVLVNVEPRSSFRLDPLVTLDLQAAKSFNVSGRHLELSLDGYNITNANTVWDIRSLTGRISLRQGGVPTGAVKEFAQFATPVSILPPRIFRVGVSYRF